MTQAIRFGNSVSPSNGEAVNHLIRHGWDFSVIAVAGLQAPYVENRKQSWVPWSIGSFTYSTDLLSLKYVLGTTCTLGIQAMRRRIEILQGSTEARVPGISLTRVS